MKPISINEEFNLNAYEYSLGFEKSSFVTVGFPNGEVKKVTLKFDKKVKDDFLNTHYYFKHDSKRVYMSDFKRTF